jgi:carboxyl-terminal processing protease
VTRHLALVAALSLGTLVPAATRAQDPPVVRKRTAYEDLQMFSQVLNQIRINHPDSLEAHELIMAAILGMVRSADPHSYVIPALRLDPAKEAQLASGKLVPVPLTFDFVGGTPVVVSVASGSSARQAGILPGDALIAIDGKAVMAESAFELGVILAGARGSMVRLDFEREREDGTTATISREVKRERANEASAVPASLMLDATTGYIRVTTFVGEKVADDLHKALEQLGASGMQRLVLDLRDNGGGSIDEAARVTGEFLPEGRIVFTATGRKAAVIDTGRVKRAFWKSEQRYPIIVMVNEGTASASELVAGALQDHDRALIYGRPTFGKSLMMRGFPLTDGSVIVLVVGHVRTPCGRVVQRDYRSITRRDYFRLAAADRDTAGRPSCKTTAGRTVYGGGGIYPDVVSPTATAVPRWLEAVREQQVVITWANTYVAEATDLTSIDALTRSRTLPAAAIASFRAASARQGVPVPDGSEVDAMLQRVLAEAVAYAKWGEEGSYRVAALLDPEVHAMLDLFGRASSLGGTPR